MAMYKNELSWSASRANEFNRCRREYHYGRYQSWGWWTERPRGLKHRTMTLKNLTSVPALAGTCVHDGIELWFRLKRAGEILTTAELTEKTKEMFRQGWMESSSGEWQKAPNKAVHLVEHHRNATPSAEENQATKELIERSIAYFMESEECRPTREADPTTWKSLETMDTYLFQGTKIYAIPDFAYEVDGVTHIWDWKTGKERESDMFQLHSYALYAAAKWGIDPTTAVLHAAYLNLEKVVTKEAGSGTLNSVEATMKDSIAEMRELHYDPDVEGTDPLNWPKTPDTYKCKWCRFKDICL
jgi:CRISPR/Cas system-associated exonuclease Cas4 (RecB family)